MVSRSSSRRISGLGWRCYPDGQSNRSQQLRSGWRCYTLSVARTSCLRLEEGDFEGAAVWRTILGAIKELQRAIKPDEAVN